MKMPARAAESDKNNNGGEGDEGEKEGDEPEATPATNEGVVTVPFDLLRDIESRAARRALRRRAEQEAEELEQVRPTWLPRGPSCNSRALSKLHSLLPSIHRMCFLLIRQPKRASFGCVLALESLGGAPRVRAQPGLHRAQQSVRCISSEAAPNRSALAGNYYRGITLFANSCLITFGYVLYILLALR